jgi:integrative and conjugative element protein (TIGR02256 family)
MIMRIELTASAMREIREALRKAGDSEVGGILMAEQLAAGRFCITDVSVDQVAGSRASFRRDPTTHRQTLEAFYARNGHDYERFNYLGEWHSHPTFSVRPSSTDVQTMTDIVNAETSTITFAALLIVRLRWLLSIDHSLTLFARHQAPQSIRLRRRVVFI